MQKAAFVSRASGGAIRDGSLEVSSELKQYFSENSSARVYFVSNILRLCADYQRSSPVVSVKINEAQEAAAQRDGGSRLHRCVCFSCLTRRVVFRGLRHIEGCFGSAGQNDRSGWRFDCV